MSEEEDVELARLALLGKLVETTTSHWEVSLCEADQGRGPAKSYYVCRPLPYGMGEYYIAETLSESVSAQLIERRAKMVLGMWKSDLSRHFTPEAIKRVVGEA
jgi:hypothetical protein